MWTFEPFQRQRWGNFSETGWSACGLFRPHRYHLELSWTIAAWNPGFSGLESHHVDFRAASKAALGELLRDGVKRMWAFPSA